MNGLTLLYFHQWHANISYLMRVCRKVLLLSKNIFNPLNPVHTTFKILSLLHEATLPVLPGYLQVPVLRRPLPVEDRKKRYW